MLASCCFFRMVSKRMAPMMAKTITYQKMTVSMDVWTLASTVPRPTSFPADRTTTRYSRWPTSNGFGILSVQVYKILFKPGVSVRLNDANVEVVLSFIICVTWISTWTFAWRLFIIEIKKYMGTPCVGWLGPVIE